MPQNFGACQTCGKSVVDLFAKLAELEAALCEIDRIEKERTTPDRQGAMVDSCNTTCLQECGVIARKVLRK